jgi:hypothetical protein
MQTLCYEKTKDANMNNVYITGTPPKVSIAICKTNTASFGDYGLRWSFPVMLKPLLESKNNFVSFCYKPMALHLRQTARERRLS